VVVLGGPEVSYESEQQPICDIADVTIAGEADLEFARVCSAVLRGEALPVKFVRPSLPSFDQLALPYEFYTEQDIAHRLIYVEASRGCPFSCEFCLSSLDVPVRQVPLPQFLGAIDSLLQRGAKHLKFVDRTFNLNANVSNQILDFLLERYRPGQFFHFEIVPDRVPETLKERLAKFASGSIQLEAGVQTFNPEVGTSISRRQNYERLEENLHFLREHTTAHIHADLIFGLPGETLESFATGFDRLVQLRPHEIQVGILKRLRGTPISRHDTEWGMKYSPIPPYEILEHELIGFADMQRLRRFSRYWDLVGNSGNFLESSGLIMRGAPSNILATSPFRNFMQFSDWLYGQVKRTDAIALPRLFELVFKYLTQEAGVEWEPAEEALLRDYQRGGKKDRPSFLRAAAPELMPPPKVAPGEKLPKRQARRLKKFQG
jgi:hypothetical protein